MCRIDSSFSDISINEKDASLDRFNQALDEYAVTGFLRQLLNNHFSECWEDVFGRISVLEDALDNAKQVDGDEKKCVALFESDWFKLRLKASLDTSAKKLPVSCLALKNLYSDIVSTFYKDSPFGLKTSKISNLINMKYDRLVLMFYGDDFCLSASFFDDPALNALEPYQRTQELWAYFEDITQVCVDSHSAVPKLSAMDITTLVSMETFVGPPTKAIHSHLLGIKFLKAWVKYDAQALRLRGLNQDGIYQLAEWFDELNNTLEEANASNEIKSLFQKWKKETERELERVWIEGLPLNESSDERLKEHWSDVIDSHFMRYYRDVEVDFTQSDEERLEYDKHCMCDYLSQMLSSLSQFKQTVWIQHTIARDFQAVLKSDENSACSKLLRQQKWCFPQAYALWKEQFLNALQSIDLESRLCVLALSAPISPLLVDSEADVNAFATQHINWWNGLLFELVNSEEFPKYLLPKWCVAAKYRFAFDDELVPYFDASVGLLRGELAKVDNEYPRAKENHELLKELLDWLDRYAPVKAIRHRLMLSRSVKSSFTDESLNFSQDTCESQWYQPFHYFIAQQFSYVMSKKEFKNVEDISQVRKEYFLSWSQQIAEFCLSRLRLRKKEKAQNGKYTASQVTERSPVWRQGYLKALAELGFDLQGKVHKTANFIKQSDPDEDVRAVAAETYKVIRRQAKPKKSLQDLKRGLIAAEWWLLLCQRQELGLSINSSEAVKTRRRLLRNP